MSSHKSTLVGLATYYQQKQSHGEGGREKEGRKEEGRKEGREGGRRRGGRRRGGRRGRREGGREEGSEGVMFLPSHINSLS